VEPFDEAGHLGLSSAAGPQEGSLTLGSATNWYTALATFRPRTKVGQ